MPRLRALQRALQKQFGGRPQERIHLTCQRFDDQDARTLRRLKEALQHELADIDPPRIIATSARFITHDFWQMTMLRWEIDKTEILRDFLRRLEMACAAAGIAPHYPYSSGWMPSTLTALEAVEASDTQPNLGHLDFPQRLFTGSRLTFSRIVASRQFHILDHLPLDT
jgi:hypothetical protein